MSIWDWIYEYAAEVEMAEDEQRMQIVDLAHEASSYGKREPELNLARLNEGRALAKQLNESWWVLFFDHWRLQVLMHYIRDFTSVLEIAVEATLEARKPSYALFPQRICLHEDLINAYLGIDPIGHADAISQAMIYMADEVPEDVECRFCAEGCRTEFALVRNDLEEAEESARLTLEMADQSDLYSAAQHHSASACDHLCMIAHLRENREAMKEWAEMGEELSRQEDDQIGIATHLLWQALLARQDGDERTARRKRHRAVTRAKRVRSVPGAYFYNALCAYHEAGGDLEKSLRAREHELARCKGRGRFFDESQLQLKRCRLLARMGQLTEGHLAEAREAIQKLRQPEPLLIELEQLRP